MPTSRWTRNTPPPGTLDVVNKATRLATASIDAIDIELATVDALVRLFGIERADLWRIHGGRLSHAAAAGNGPSHAPAPPLGFDRVVRAPDSEGARVEAAILSIDDLSSEGDRPWRSLLADLNCSTVGIYGLDANGRQLGCITVAHGDAHTGKSLVEALSLFADQVANALDKARLHDEAHRAIDAVELQNRMLRDLTDCRNAESIAWALERHLSQFEPGARAALAMFDGHGRVLALEPAAPGRVSLPRIATAVEHDLLAALAGNSNPRLSADRWCGGDRSAAEPPFALDRQGEVRGVVLQAAGRELGVLIAACDESGSATRIETFLETAAPAVAIGLQNAMLFARTQQRSDRLAAVNELVRSIAGAPTLSELNHRLVGGVLETFGYTRVAIYDAQLGVSAEDGESPSSQAAEVQLVATASRRRRPSRAEQVDRMRIAVPITTRGSLYAVLYAEQPEQSSVVLDDNDSTMLEGVAEHAAAILTAIGAYEDLERNYLSTVQALVSALEASDQYTHDHSNDVARWAVEVGHRFGLDEQGIKDLELGAVFHDIGKIAIPNEILNKPGKLTEEEFEIMKTHTIVGERIIAPIEFLERVRPIVRHEHERWDGRGYPDGISGEEIPLGSRIIFVCDAYHAITSDRPYREAQSHEVAKRVLVENAGSQFDAAVVSVFLDVIEEYRAQCGQFLDAGNETIPLPPPLQNQPPHVRRVA